MTLQPKFYSFSVQILPILLFYLLLFSIIPESGFEGDIGCWKGWSIYIYENGISNVYNSDTNYPPIFLFILRVFNHFQSSTIEIETNIKYLKIIPLFFDFLPAILLAVFHKSFLEKNLHWLLLFNTAYLYNTLIWGQVDSIHTNLAFSSIFFSFSSPVTSVLLFVLALNTKLQAVVFLPLLLLIFILKKPGLKTIVRIIFSASILQLIILLPFIISGGFTKYSSMVFNSMGYWPYVSMNAYNVWYLIGSINPLYIRDDSILYIMTYKSYGLILFFVFSTLVLLPLLLKITKRKQLPDSEIQSLAYLTAAMIAIVFFFFNTEMHERYSHPALIFLFMYAILTGRYTMYAVCSFAILLNMEKVLQHYKIAYHTLIFDTRFIAFLFFIVLLIGLYELYKNSGLLSDFPSFRSGLEPQE